MQEINLSDLELEIEKEELDIHVLSRQRERRFEVYHKHLVCGIPDENLHEWELKGDLRDGKE